MITQQATATKRYKNILAHQHTSVSSEIIADSVKPI